MSRRWASSSLGCFLLLVLVPLSASAAPKDPCKLLQRDLDQQIDDLKAWQQLDLQECSRISGSNSDACRQLKDLHAQDLRAFRDNREFQMTKCRGSGPRTLAAASPFEISNNDFYEKYYKNRGPCVEYRYVYCDQYDHYVHAKHHHHHHYYTDSPSGSGKVTSAYSEKPATSKTREYADKSAKQDGAPIRGTVRDSSAQPAHHDSRSDRDNSANHGSSRNDSSATASSHHNHDSGGASYSGGSHGSGAGSDSHASSSSAGSSSSGASHSSGGGGSSSSGSSSSGVSNSGAGSSVSSGASASSPASSPSHDSGGSRPK
jgi:hypothetical protein